MKLYITVSFLFFNAYLVFAQPFLNLKDIITHADYKTKLLSDYNMMADGVYYLTTGLKIENNIDSVYITKHNLIDSTERHQNILFAKKLYINGKPIFPAGFTFNNDESKLLINQKPTTIYRHSSYTTYFVYDLKSTILTPLSDKQEQMFPTFSPKGDAIAFIYKNNIYIKNLISNKEAQITKDGELNKIKNGWADWVYEEEFSEPVYFAWNADGTKLAFVRFDESKVKEFNMEIFNGNSYPDKESFKYPKAGEANSTVSLLIYDITTAKTKSVALGKNPDIYIPRIKWTNDAATLSYEKLNRLQNNLELHFVNIKTWVDQIILTETSTTYVDITDNLTFVDNTGFIWSSESSGYNHLYFYNLNGTLINQITNGNWDVVDLKAFDPSSKKLYFTSTEYGQMNRTLFSININGNEKAQLTSANGTANPKFLKGFKYFLNSYSDINTPPVYTLHSINGDIVKVLESHQTLNDKKNEHVTTNKTYFSFKNSDSILLHGWMKLPNNFDPRKKYPVYMYAYNGPGSNASANQWNNFDYWWHSLLNQEGYIVTCVDGRGTMGRGKDFKHSTFMQLGHYETKDQIEAAQYLSNLEYIDRDRIGFQGWSFGGYLASLLISKGADYFKAAIAVAPVTNWKYYDNIYTERFLQTPQSNKLGYENNSPINFAKNIKGNFLLIHGSADDNVHYQNSMELANELVKHNIAFDFMVYPNKNHGIYGGQTRLHLYTKMLEFIKAKL